MTMRTLIVRLRAAVTSGPMTVALVASAALATGLPVLAQRAPAPAATNLPAEVLSLACAPSLTYEPPDAMLRVIGSQESVPRRSFAPGDLITINAGTDSGVDVGKEYYTRRALPTEDRPVGRNYPATIRTTGWIRVYAVDRQASLATITHACDAVELNDYLEPFTAPEIPAVSADRPAPQRDNYGRVLEGNDHRTTFAQGDYFLIDRGGDHGVTVGAQFVVYRDTRQTDSFLFDLGEAVAVAVKPGSATLRVTLSRDALVSGDYVALRK